MSQVLYQRHGWLLISLLFIALLVISMLGFRSCVGTHQCDAWLTDVPKSSLDTLFFTLQMLVMNYGGVHGDAPWTIQLARFGLPVLTSLSVIKGVVEVAAYRHLSFRLHFWREHIVFCGGGDQSRALILQYLKQPHPPKIVVVDVRDVPENKALWAQGAKFLKEDAKLPDVLRRVGIQRARCVYIMAGSDQTNVEIFKHFAEVIGLNATDAQASQHCFVHLYDPTLRAAVDQHWRKDHPANAWQIQTHNTWESAARDLMTGQYAPHLHSDAPHILILGASWLTEQLIIQGARLGHYPNGQKLRLTCVDEQAHTLRDRFYAQYPALDPKPAPHLAWHTNELALLPVIDTHFVAHPAEGFSSEQFAEICATPISIAYICQADDEKALHILAALRANLPAHNGKKTSIVLCDMHPHQIHDTLNLHDLYPEVHHFNAVAAGILLEAGALGKDDLREVAAKAIHQDYCQRHGGLSWAQLSEDSRESNRQSADHWKIKFDWLQRQNNGVLPTDLAPYQDRLMRLEHDRWVAERLMGGWRYVARPQTKAEEPSLKANKLNWCLCPFDALSQVDQQKDQDVCEVARKIFSLYQA